LMLSFDTESPESGAEDSFSLFQGLSDDLRERFDDLG
jgi:hypothetical protein